MLRIQDQRLGRREAEERGVEPVGVLDHAGGRDVVNGSSVGKTVSDSTPPTRFAQYSSRFAAPGNLADMPTTAMSPAVSRSRWSSRASIRSRWPAA